MVDAVHSISTQIQAATAGHKRIETILKRRELMSMHCLLVVTVVSSPDCLDCNNSFFNKLL